MYRRPAAATLVFLARTARARIVLPNLGSVAPRFAGVTACRALPMEPKVPVGAYDTLAGTTNGTAFPSETLDSGAQRRGLAVVAASVDRQRCSSAVRDHSPGRS